MTDELEFNWGELGEEWWRDAGAKFNATEKQIKVACALHRGCTDSGAAKEAGYKGDANSIRQAAYKAVRGTAVRNMLALAKAETDDTPDGVMDREEIKTRLSELARNADSSTKIRAMELLAKIEDKQAELGRTVDGDGFSDWRMVRTYLGLPGGGPAVVYLLALGAGNSLASLPLLHDVYKAVIENAPEVWDSALKRQSAVMRVAVEQHLADQSWQYEARQKIWREIGIEIEPLTGPAATVNIDAAQSEAASQ